MTLSEKELRRCLAYNPSTGQFRWITKRPGQLAGSTNDRGYTYIKIDGVSYKASRLAYLYMTGDFPPKGYWIDHKNLNRSDDSWRNLRLCTPQQNLCNQAVRKNNKTGFKGVHYRASRQLFEASIKVNYKRIFLGRYATAKEAHAAYVQASKMHHGQFGRTE